jgi:hypothetical protein
VDVMDEAVDGGGGHDVVAKGLPLPARLPT